MSISTLTFDRPASARHLLGRVDAILVLATLVLAAFGVLMVYSATRDGQAAAGLSTHYYLVRQGIYVVIGTVVMVVFTVVDYHWMEHAAMALYAGLVLALLAMFVVGQSALGATRWISIAGFQLQPSAFAALVEVAVVAGFCARRPDGLERGDILKVLALQAVPILLVVKQPDLGSGMVMAVVLLVTLIMAGVPNRYLVLLLLLAAVGVFGMVHFHLLKEYQLQRLTGFLNQNKGTQGTNYNLTQSTSAIGSGGLFGAGLFHGVATNLAQVPEQQTDFIFSAVGEQLGFVGSVTVLAVEAVICWRVLRAAQLARDSFGRLLAIGAFTLLAFSVFENAGMTMGIMPIAGIPLPFLSYGGSATIAFFAAVGVASSVHLRQR